MNRQYESHILLAAALAAATLIGNTALADYKNDIDYYALSSKLGSSLPTGSNVTVCQIEPPVPEYMPDTNNLEFVGKTFYNVSGSSTGASWHATPVGQYLYGTSASIAPGITNIRNYEADDWLGAGLLKAFSPNPPSIETCRIENLSAVKSGDSESVRRLDYAVDRDGFVSVVGLDNGAVPIPMLMAHAYNTICVGLTSGNHSRGPTTNDTPGRVKPDIVAPMGQVSHAVPVVSGASAMLIEKAGSGGALTNAGKPQCIKAILLAGATKDEFPSWSRTASSPLDSVFGAGELNIYNSYHILTAGQQAASTNTLVSGTGWDFVSIPQGTSAWWFIEVPASNVMTRLSIVATWHRRITGPFPFPSAFVPDLDLHLHTATNFDVGPVIDSSTSRVDNVEHIYRRYLQAGRYAIEVQSINSTTNCALAWYSRMSLIPTITNIALTGSNVQFAATATPAIPYAVEASTNLLATNGWVRVVTNVPSTNVFVFVETNSANFISRFYRLVPDP